MDIFRNLLIRRFFSLEYKTFKFFIFS